MHKLDRGTSGSTLAALLACIALAVAAAPAAATRGCPQVALKRQLAPRNIAHPPARAVLACVGTTPITGAQLTHRSAIEHHQFPDTAPEGLASGAMTVLIADASIEGETRERHIVVTARDVRRAFDRLLHSRYRKPGSLRRHLRSIGESLADFRAELRLQLLVAALMRHETRGQLARFYDKWKARTSCALAYSQDVACGLIAPRGAGPPSIGVGKAPVAIAVDETTDTIYVADARDGTLTMIDGKTCNAAAVAGCSRAVRVKAPHGAPSVLAIDPATNTIYVGSGDVSAIDGHSCNATTVTGCRHAASVHFGPDSSLEQLALDPATHTLYVADAGADAVWAVDASACNAAVTSGCARTPARAKVGGEPRALALAATTGTLYVANSGDGTLSLLDARTCNAAVTSGCARAAPTVRARKDPHGVSVDPATGAVYVASEDQSRLSVLDGSACNVAVVSGCTARATVRLGNADAFVALDPLSALALDAPTHTAYVAAPDANGVLLLSTAACNATIHAGCVHPHLARTGSEPLAVAVDERTRTVYVVNGGGDSVSLIRADRCNATTTAGC